MQGPDRVRVAIAGRPGGALGEAFGGAYRGRRVLVTGHTGFKGSWLAVWLARLGAEVHGYALEPPTEPSLFDEAGVRHCLASHRIGDVRDAAGLSEAVRAVEPEVVFHLAAQPLVRASYLQPRETFEVNVMGTVNLLEAVRQTSSVRVCQIITTDKCYENHESIYAYRESDPLGGHDPYSSSKGCAELVVSAYRRSYFPPERIAEHGVCLSSVRAGNVIGGDWALDRILPDCVRALAAGRPILVRNPASTRPWQHVLEPLSGYLHLAARQWREPGAHAGAWNFGPTDAANVTVHEVVELALGAWGAGSWELPNGAAAPQPAPHEAKLLHLDITKAVRLLGWRPVLSVSEAVADTVGWYRARHARGEAFDGLQECGRQIEAYAARAAAAGLGWAAASARPEPIPANAV